MAGQPAVCVVMLNRGCFPLPIILFYLFIKNLNYIILFLIIAKIARADNINSINKKLNPSQHVKSQGSKLEQMDKSEMPNYRIILIFSSFNHIVIIVIAAVVFFS